MISRRQFFKAIGGLGALSASTAAYGFGEPVLRLRVARYDITPTQWPADFPLKIAVIADLHACDPWMSLERIQAIVERTNALDADIIVLLGDYVAGHRHVTRTIPASEWAPVLAGLIRIEFRFVVPAGKAVVCARVAVRRRLVAALLVMVPLPARSV